MSKRKCTNEDRRIMLLGISAGNEKWIADYAQSIGLDRFDTKDGETLFHQWAELAGDNAGRDVPADLQPVQRSFQQLQQLGLDINRTNGSGIPPLLYFLRYANAINKERLCSIFELFLACGANPNLCDYYGQTPLHSVARGGLRLAQLMVQHGAELNAINMMGQRPIAGCFSRASAAANIANFLAEAGAQLPSGERLLHLAADAGDLVNMERMLRLGHDINERDYMGRTPLFYAEDPLTAQFLLNHGVAIDAVDRLGRTALAAALGGGINQTIGSDVRFRDNDLFKVVLQLLQAGSDLNEMLLPRRKTVHQFCRQLTKSKDVNEEQKFALRAMLAWRAAAATLAAAVVPEP